MRLVPSFFVLIILNVAVLEVPTQCIAQDLVWRDQRLCGANCAYIYLSLLEIDINYETARDSLAPDESGTSFKDMKEFLMQYKNDVSVVKSSPERLDRLTLPAIVFMEPPPSDSATIGHFNVLISVDDSEVSYIDGTTGGVRKNSRAGFSKRWSGAALNQSSPNLLPYIGICLIGCLYLSYQSVRYCIKRPKVVSAAAVFVMALLSSRSEAQVESITEKGMLIKALKERTSRLASGRLRFLKYNIHPGQPDEKVYAVEFGYFKNKRYLKQTDFRDGVADSTSLRGFDGEVYRDKFGLSFQIHNQKSAQIFEAGRFDNLYLPYLGIMIPDPLLKQKSNKRNFETSIISILENHRFTAVVLPDGLLELRQMDPFFLDNNTERILCDPKNGYRLIKREIYTDTEEKISEFEFLDYRKIQDTGVELPKKILFRSFDVFQRVDRSYGLKLAEFQSPISDLTWKPLKPFPGAILVDYRHINEKNQKTVKPKVFYAGVTTESIAQSIDQIKEDAKQKKSNGYGLLIGMSVLVVVVSAFVWYRNNMKVDT